MHSDKEIRLQSGLKSLLVLSMNPLTIWCNAKFPEPAMARLRERLGAHRLLLPQALQKSNLAAGAADPMLAEADIAFGQPDPVQAMQLPRLKWVHLTTAGYTRYDREDLRAAFSARARCLRTARWCTPTRARIMRSRSCSR